MEKKAGCEREKTNVLKRKEPADIEDGLKNHSERFFMNIFDVPRDLVKGERSELLIPDKGVRIERIVSKDSPSPPGFWYDQERDEWVCLIQGQARILWEDGRRQSLVAGDWLLIPAHEKHRVEETSENPPCIWIAVHGKLTGINC